MQILEFEHATISIFRIQKFFFVHSQTMETIADEIMAEMMIGNESVTDEFYPLPPLYPEIEDALWEDPVEVK